ncbi:MAG TPA: DMT family transporter [Anaerovoracaceae bacterium]|nr:DMT family transporter [Anaerovoracaceae bacterium]
MSANKAGKSLAADHTKIKKESNLKVYGSAVLFSLIVGFSFIGVKTCISVATPLETLTYRFNFAFLAALMPVILGFTKINVQGKPKIKLALTAGFYVGFMILQTIGLLFSTSIESGIIFAIIPILAKIISGIFLKEGTNWKQNIFVCMSVAAVITMFILGASDITVNVAGLIVLMISSLSMAISNVMMRYVRGTYRPFEITFFITAGGCILFNLATIVFGIKNGTLGDYFEPLSHMNFIFATAYLGIPSTLISAMLMAYMLANMEAVKATIFGNLSTAISIVAGVIVLKEPLELYHIICTILIIIGVIGLSMPSMAKKKD